MANLLLIHRISSFFFSISFMASLFLIHFSSAFSPKQLLNASAVEAARWSSGGATWYGSPTGAGSDGGACGYGCGVGQPPFSSMVSAGGPSLFMSGRGCGACYEVKCMSNSVCSKKPVKVVITDECPGGPCVSESAHFDLSGTAFGKLAVPGKEDQLRNAGILQIQYRRVDCNYPGVNIVFHVDAGSSGYYFATLIEYEDGDGDLASVELEECSSGVWHPMQQSWGALWKLQAGSSPLKAPFSLRLKAGESGKTVVATNVIPIGWSPGGTYRSNVNF